MLWQPPLPDRYLQMPDDELAAAIGSRRRELGSDLLILGHHYQQDDVVRHADLTGDSLKLSQMAATEAAKRGVKYIVFCGVHFMAETADIVTDESVQVILPDLSAGCSMADMAEYDDVVLAWEQIHEAIGADFAGRVIPITYVNSAASIKAFVGDHGGACCTSTNAGAIFDWARAGGVEPGGDAKPIKILFLPDQHLGRNTAASRGFVTEVHEREGRGRAQTRVWNPRADHGGLTPQQVRDADILLWAGHCSVHKLFRPEHVLQARDEFADAGGCTVIVHPECAQEVVDLADLSGSTNYIISALEAAEPGTNWVIGTEVHLVQRLAAAAAARGVHARILSDCQCLCTTMYRIDQAHLLWVLDHLSEGTVVNRVTVPPEVRRLARLSLDRMLANAGGATPPREPAASA